MCVFAALQKEATEVFFSVTKLFQAKDANLRRMVYLVIKEVQTTHEDRHLEMENAINLHDDLGKGDWWLLDGSSILTGRAASQQQARMQGRKGGLVMYSTYTAMCGERCQQEW